MRGPWFYLVAVAIAGIAWSSCRAAQGDNKAIVVTLRAGATVDEPLVPISAVATLQGGDASLRQRLGKLDIAEVATVGRAVTVSRDQVAYRIQLAGVSPESFRVEGPALVVVKMATVEPTQAEVVKTAKHAVLQRLEGNPHDYDLKLFQPVQEPNLHLTADQQLRLAVEGAPSPMGSGKTRVTVAYYVDGQRQGTAYVTLEVTRYRPVALVTHPLEAGQLLQPEDVRQTRRVVEPGDVSLHFGEQLFGKRVLRAVAPGQTLAVGDLDVPPPQDLVLIRARDTVSLIANIGKLRVMAVGEAQEDGRAGQVIRVRNTESNRVVSGRVVGRAMVEVDY